MSLAISLAKLNGLPYGTGCPLSVRL